MYICNLVIMIDNIKSIGIGCLYNVIEWFMDNFEINWLEEWFFFYKN